MSSPAGTGIGVGGTGSNANPTGGTSAQTARDLPLSAVDANVRAMPSIESLTNQINALNRSAQSAANTARIPDAAALEQASSRNIADQLAGRISSSTNALLNQVAAERNILRGTPSDAAYLQLLGRTAEQQIQAGQQNLSAAYGRNPAAPLWDPSMMMLTPYQAGQLQLEQQRQMLMGQTAAGRSGSQPRQPQYGQQWSFDPSLFSQPSRTTTARTPTYNDLFYTPSTGGTSGLLPNYSNSPGVNVEPTYDYAYDLPGYNSAGGSWENTLQDYTDPLNLGFSYAYGGM